MTDGLRMYGDFEVIAKDSDGNVIQTREIEDTGTFTIEDVRQNALLHGLDEFKIIPKGFETRKDGETEIRVEPDGDTDE